MGQNRDVMLLKIVVAIGFALVLYTFIAATLRKFHMAPPAEPDPEDILPVDYGYRCGVCGATVTMTMAPQGELPAAPRHCREDMDLVSAGGAPPALG
ncbi:MAG: hypothetical protein JWL73_3162 [Actinomycetia bacterium]|nr:hypothetical protein [Actinomycetes bacterium]